MNLTATTNTISINCNPKAVITPIIIIIIIIIIIKDGLLVYVSILN